MSEDSSEKPKNQDGANSPGQGTPLPEGPITRRDFVATGGSILLAATATACVSEGYRSIIVDPPPTATIGSIHVSVGGLAGATAGGQASALRADGQGETYSLTLDPPTAGVTSGNLTDIPTGSYNVSYSPPTGFQLSTSSANPRVAGVTGTAPADVTFLAVQIPGSLHVTVTGIAGAANGGQLTAIRTDATGGSPISATLPAPVAGTSTLDVGSIPPGSYSVTFTPPTGFRVPAGTANPQAITITSSATANLSLDLVRATGSLRIQVNGLAAGASGGGTAQVLRTDIGGQSPVPVTIDASGVLDVPLEVGTYSVTFTPPSGYELPAGQTNFRNATIADSATSTVTYQVSQVVTPTAGTLRVQVTGLQAGASSGGSVSALRTDIGGQSPIVAAVAASGSVDVSLQGGTYDVTYTPPAGYQLNAGQTNPQSATITNGATSNVGFAVSVIAPTTGTMRVQVSGILAGAPNGGSAAIQRTDIPGQSAVTVQVPTSGTVDSTVQAGTYTVTYLPPSGYQLNAGQTNPRNLTITSGQTSTASYQVSQTATPVGVVFHSDWSTALGTSDNAIMDNGKSKPWTLAGGNGLAVVSSAGLDFPTTNALRVTALGSTSGFALLRVTGLPVPGVGQSRYYRWYSRMVLPDDVEPNDDETHPHQDGNAASDSNWLFHVYHDAPMANHWMPQFRGEAAFPNDRFGGNTGVAPIGPQLQKNVTYRFEVKITRTGTSTFTMDVRVYDSAGVLLYDGDDFQNQVRTATINTRTFNVNNLGNLGQFNAGLNGLGTGSTAPWYPSSVYMYQGAVAISGTDWLGPYSGGI